MQNSGRMKTAGICSAVERDPVRSFATKAMAREVGPGDELLAFYADHHVVPLPNGHRFPMDK